MKAVAQTGPVIVTITVPEGFFVCFYSYKEFKVPDSVLCRIIQGEFWTVQKSYQPKIYTLSQLLGIVQNPQSTVKIIGWFEYGWELK